jgi:hypothetical protein
VPRFVIARNKPLSRRADAQRAVGVGVNGRFVFLASAAGARTLEISLDPSGGTSLFAEPRYGPAGTLVPAYVTELLGR